MARFEEGQNYTGYSTWNTIGSYLCIRRTEKYVYFQCQRNAKPCRFNIRKSKDGEYVVNPSYCIHAWEQTN